MSTSLPVPASGNDNSLCELLQSQYDLSATLYSLQQANKNVTLDHVRAILITGRAQGTDLLGKEEGIRGYYTCKLI